MTTMTLEELHAFFISITGREPINGKELREFYEMTNIKIVLPD